MFSAFLLLLKSAIGCPTAVVDILDRNWGIIYAKKKKKKEKVKRFFKAKSETAKTKKVFEIREDFFIYNIKITIFARKPLEKNIKNRKKR